MPILKTCYHKSNSKNDCEKDNECVWDKDINICKKKSCNINKNKSKCNKKINCKWDKNSCRSKYCKDYDLSMNGVEYCFSGSDPLCKWNEDKKIGLGCVDKLCGELEWLNSPEKCSQDRFCKWDGKACRLKECVEYELGKKICKKNGNCKDFNNKDLEFICNKEKKIIRKKKKTTKKKKS
tara:strand:- start:127 stop:666 length:540 start_codon:yes stop_codon:yes gene_type:complete